MPFWGGRIRVFVGDTRYREVTVTAACIVASVDLTIVKPYPVFSCKYIDIIIYIKILYVYLFATLNLCHTGHIDVM